MIYPLELLISSTIVSFHTLETERIVCNLNKGLFEIDIRKCQDWVKLCSYINWQSLSMTVKHRNIEIQYMNIAEGGILSR